RQTVTGDHGGVGFVETRPPNQARGRPSNLDERWSRVSGVVSRQIQIAPNNRGTRKPERRRESVMAFSRKNELLLERLTHLFNIATSDRGDKGGGVRWPAGD